MSHDLDAMEARLSGRADRPPEARRGGAPPSGETRLRPSSRTALLIGILLGVLVAGGGLVYAATHSPTWSTHREVVVVPSSGTDVSNAAALYDSLSRGQVVATVAEIYGQSRWHADTPQVTVTAGVVPPSAVVQVTATGPDKAVVARTLDQVMTAGSKEINATIAPYRAVVLTETAPAPTAIGLGRGVMAVVALLVGLFVGVLATGLCRRLSRPTEA